MVLTIYLLFADDIKTISTTRYVGKFNSFFIFYSFFVSSFEFHFIHFHLKTRPSLYRMRCVSLFLLPSCSLIPGVNPRFIHYGLSTLKVTRFPFSGGWMSFQRYLYGQISSFWRDQLVWNNSTRLEEIVKRLHRQVEWYVWCVW